MKLNPQYKKQIAQILSIPEPGLSELLAAVSFKKVLSGTMLLSAGEVATQLMIVMQGCLRQFFIKEDGKDVTFQFFIENQMVASFESVTTGAPSRLYIEAIEDSVIGFLPMRTLFTFTSKRDSRLKGFNTFLINRLVYYMNRCSSYIMDSPQQRYQSIVKENPTLVDRLPKHYLASYLGVTPVSLSRIRSRLKKKSS